MEIHEHSQWMLRADGQWGCWCGHIFTGGGDLCYDRHCRECGQQFRGQQQQGFCGDCQRELGIHEEVFGERE